MRDGASFGCKRSQYERSEAAASMRSLKAPSVHEMLCAIVSRFGRLRSIPSTAPSASPRSSDWTGDMGGRLSKSRDLKSWKVWGAAVSDIADRIGMERIELWKTFRQLALMVEFEKKLPTPIAEESAWHLLRGSFDKTTVANEIDGWVH